MVVEEEQEQEGVNGCKWGIDDKDRHTEFCIHFVGSLASLASTELHIH